MLDSSFIDPWPMDLYTPNAITDVVFQLPENMNLKNLMRGSTIGNGTPTISQEVLPSPNKKWSKEEIELLKTSYPQSSRERIIATLPKRSWKAIKARACRLKIQRDIVTWNKGLHIRLNTGKTHIKKGQRLSPNTEIKKGQHLSPSTEFKPQFNIPKNELYNLYWVKKLSPEKIGKIYGCCALTIHYWLRKYGHGTRNCKEAAIINGKKRKKTLPKDILCKLYNGDKLSLKDIAKALDVSIMVISRELKRYGIPKRLCVTVGERNPRYGKPPSKETREHWSEIRKGRTLSEEHKEKISLGLKKSFDLRSEIMKEKWKDPEYKEKQSKAHIGKMTGSDNPRWRGGWEPYYGPTWHSQKRKARQRDGGICYMCSANEKDHPRRFDIHHIEPYRVSHDNSLENLMTLCPSCHKRMEYITSDN